jgi:hypothetical protein
MRQTGVELLVDTVSGVYASGSCEEIGHSIKVATVVEMVQPLDCKREPSTRFTPHGGD